MLFSSPTDEFLWTKIMDLSVAKSSFSVFYNMNFARC